MKKLFKKIVVLFLIASIILCPLSFSTPTNTDSLLTVKASAESSYVDGYYTYTVDKYGNATITDCDTSISGNVTIPSTLDGYTVTSIGVEAFRECVNLRNVTIPNGITNIGGLAFCGCSGITGITISNSVTNIGFSAFFSCSNLQRITIPDGVTVIESSTFEYCSNLTTIIIPNNLTYIGYNAFSNCINLTNITIPDSVMDIGYSAFDNTGYYNNESNWVDDVLYIGNHLIKAKDCISGYYTVNDGTKTIANSAFSGCSDLTGVTISNSVSGIGGRAFSGCSSLVSASIGNSVTNLNYGVFADCTGLENITIPGNVKSIGSSSFSSCTSLKNVTLCEGIEEIGYNAFNNCTGLTKITLPDSVRKIDDEAFQDCTNLESIIIPDGITSVGSRVFDNTAYYNNNSNWEDGVLYIGNCLIKANSDISSSYEINTGTKIIAGSAFYECDGLSDITIPEGATCIGEHAFAYCDNLLNVIIPNSIITIDYCAFSNCVNLNSIVIPDSVETIGAMAFKECTNLVYITLPDSITNIYYDAFYKSGYYNDESNWENDILYIGKHLVDSKSSVIGLYEIKAGTKTVASWAFANCKDLTKIIIPNSITNISAVAFSDCDNLDNVYYTGTEEEWNAITIGDSNDSLLDATIHFNYIIPERNIYNHGEETYSFDNFSDSISGGHCFGISITSSGYYLGELDVSEIRLNSPSELYSVSLSSDVKEPICYYQQIQGSKRDRSTVAGGSWYLYGYNDISADWADVVDYVKNHEYDGKGNLQIGFRGVQWGGNSEGHAINFLRYENVNGQDRIYAYDNNFPEIETYFYQDSNGNIKQTPYETFAVSIDCISLRSIPLYFTLANEADTTRYIYAEKDTISIDGASAYVMDGDVGTDEQVMFEIPANFEHVIITPLVNNAKFTYLNNEYSFGNVDGDTVGIFKLATKNGDSEQNIGLTIINKSKIPEISIKSPSTTTINYGDKIILHADLTRILPNGWEVKWTASNGNFSYSVSDDGTTCTISPSSSGDTIFTASVVDANGNIISTDEQIITSKAGFFQKIIAFFKKLFGLTKTIPQIYKGTL